MQTQKAKIEAIFPLNKMQQNLLFHHLTHKEDDQGFLNVQCLLKGKLNLPVFKSAWQELILRHPILRTTVHWKKISNPLLVVQPSKKMQWNEQDWSDLSSIEQEEKLTLLKISNRKTGLDFEKGPLTEISLIKTGKDTFCMLWCCHHLLLDGWSTSILLQDLFHFYEGLCEDKLFHFESIPSYKSYLKWLDETDMSIALKYWKKAFENFETPALFNPNQSHNFKQHLNHTEVLSKAMTQKTLELAQGFQITLNTLFQGIWTLLLSKYFNKYDIVFGNTVSGRSGAFPNIELMSGMFMNVLPVRNVLKTELAVNDWLKSLQLQQQEVKNYEHFSTEQISELIELKADTPFFDNLFIFENFPWKEISTTDLVVSGFESGITTTYPVTVTVKTEDQLRLDLLFDPEILLDKNARWFLDNMVQIIDLLSKNREVSLSEILKKTNAPGVQHNSQDLSVKESLGNSYTYTAPQNKIELQLAEIWEDIFGIERIGTTDNFFQLGGKSLMATKIFTRIARAFKIKLSPVTLLEHPTIMALANIISSGKKPESWKYVVPIKSKGTKKPLFCIHGGGGFVFFFNPLAHSMHKDRPVYALQPSGIYDAETMHGSIEEMAGDYAKEIRLIQPEGPYNILVYCFSTAVGIEMSRILKKQGHEINLIVVDSLVNQENFKDPSRVKMRIFGFIKRVLTNPIQAVRLMFINNGEKYLLPIWIKLFGSKHKKNHEKIKNNLVRIYKNYQWTNRNPAQTSLILTKKVDTLLDKEYITGWNSISKREIYVEHTEGFHHTIFDEDAAAMALKIEKLMMEDYSSF